MTAVGIVANTSREPAVACARDLVEWLAGEGVRVRLPCDLAALLGRPEMASDDETLGAVRFLVALGGDGTLLAANRIAAPASVPVLGIHLGGPASFGFLTETTPPRARAAVRAVLEGRYRVEVRLMVGAEVYRGDALVTAAHALNDLVIRAEARMLKMRVSVGGNYIATYAADGIIVATPTGSTAYNLAAGGPLVHPAVETLLVTPICPHTLNVRSLLVGADEEIGVGLDSSVRDVPLLTVDGQVGIRLRPGDCVSFRRSNLQGRFISLDGPNFYEKVQTRLRLGERFGT